MEQVENVVLLEGPPDIHHVKLIIFHQQDIEHLLRYGVSLSIR